MSGNLCSQSQSTDFQFESVKIEDGISDLRVTSILQDHQGFMWFGTWDGLNRYDGYEYRVYRHDPADSTSLQNNYVEELYEDSQGNIWIGTWGTGLSRYVRETDAFVRYKPDPADPNSIDVRSVASIYETKDGHLWFGSVADGDGLARLDPRTGQFKHFRHHPEDTTSISNGGPIWLIYEDSQSNLWIGVGQPANERGDGGLNLYQPDTENFVRYQHDPQDPTSLRSNSVMSALEDRYGNFWVGTAGDGLHLMDREQGTFEHFPYVPGQPEKLSGPQGNLGTILSLEEDAQGRLWIGGGDGLVMYDQLSQQVTRFLPGAEASRGLQSNWVWEMGADRFGNLWLGSGNFGGLEKISQKPALIEEYRQDLNGQQSLKGEKVSALMPTKDQNIWIGTEKGINLYDPLQKQIDLFRPCKGFIMDLCRGKENAIWYSEFQNGLFRFDPASGKEQHFTNFPGKTNQAGDPLIQKLLFSQSGTLWLGTYYHGLVHYLPEKDQFVVQYWSEGQSFGIVKGLLEDRQGIIWVVASNGLFHYAPKVGQYERVMDGQDVNVVFEDAKGQIWLGMDREGLWQIDRMGNPMAVFSTRNGLASNSVYSIVEDGSGQLWLATGKKITRFQPATGNFQNFDARDGVLNFFNSYQGGDGFIDSSGHIYFGGNSGITRINTTSIEQVGSPIKILLTQVQTPRESHSILHDSAQELRLPHDENTLVFTYLGLHFANPTNNQYYYKLDNFEEEWVSAGNVRMARYTNLSPGRYTFRVKGMSSQGVWSEGDANIEVVILPPWWQTGYAYWGYAFVLVAFLYLIRRFELQRQRQKLAVQEEKLAYQKELNAITSKFVPTAFIQSLGREGIMDVRLGDAVEQDVTVMFTDIRDYTPIAEKMTPAENFRFINAFNQRLGPVIQDHRGFVNQYLGDGIMALFKDSARDALAAAIAIQRRLADYNQQRLAENLTPINLGIGLHSGPLIMGIIGDDRRMDAATISDAVNTASRIEDLTKYFKVNILLSAETLDRIHRAQSTNKIGPISTHDLDFQIRFLGRILLKGKKEPTTIYECFDGDLPEMVEKKAATQGPFQEGLNHYLSKQFADAVIAFENVLRMNPGDQTTQLFLNKARDFAMEGVPEDWTGVEVMTFK